MSYPIIQFFSPDRLTTGQLLFFGCTDPTLVMQLAQQQPQLQLTLTDPSVGVLDAARQLFADNRLADVRIIPPPPAADPGSDFDLVLIDIPQSRALARRWLCEAQQRLVEGGWLYLSGPNDLGIKSLIEDMKALFGAVQPLGYGKHARAARAQKRAAREASQPVWATAPGIMPGSWYELDWMLDGQQHRLCSLPGVFSYEHVDAGSALLLESMQVPAGARVLDAGCGYGLLGIAAALRGATRVDMLDINHLAGAAAHENSARLSLPGDCYVETLVCDGLGCIADRCYDLIVSNPPFHQGKHTDHSAVTSFIQRGHALLAPDGLMLLVANVFLRYERELAQHFRTVNVLAENRSFRVLEAYD